MYIIGLCFERRQLELNLYYQEVITTNVPGIALSENLANYHLNYFSSKESKKWNSLPPKQFCKAQLMP